MRLPTLDPTAGERARAMSLDPEVAQPLTDPTDPRFGEVPLAIRGRTGRAKRVFDPTDPECIARKPGRDG